MQKLFCINQLLLDVQRPLPEDTSGAKLCRARRVPCTINSFPLPVPAHFPFAALILFPFQFLPIFPERPLPEDTCFVAKLCPADDPLPCPLPIYYSNLFPILFTFSLTSYLLYFSHLLYFYFYFYFYFYLFIFTPHLHYIHFIFMMLYILCMSNTFQVPMEMCSHWTSTLQHLCIRA